MCNIFVYFISLSCSNFHCDNIVILYKMPVFCVLTFSILSLNIVRLRSEFFYTKTVLFLFCNFVLCITPFGAIMKKRIPMLHFQSFSIVYFNFKNYVKKKKKSIDLLRYYTVFKKWNVRCFLTSVRCIYYSFNIDNWWLIRITMWKLFLFLLDYKIIIQK